MNMGCAGVSFNMRSGISEKTASSKKSASALQSAKSTTHAGCMSREWALVSPGEPWFGRASFVVASWVWPGSDDGLADRLLSWPDERPPKDCSYSIQEEIPESSRLGPNRADPDFSYFLRTSDSIRFDPTRSISFPGPSNGW